ncbi:MAG: aminodeoxychorismate/anthranilate synthase component II [Bdellovibrionales bacterium]|nr:aminodeoxychorismate/anthranilate synthase component II [Bdellovibrionales bacterium]
MNFVLIDNFDSFTYNLRDLIISTAPKGTRVTVLRSDQSLHEIDKLQPQALFISPGPGRPHKDSLSYQALNKYYKQLPIFGVCLGMQYINEFFGGKTQLSPLPLHGKTSDLNHDNSLLFSNIPSPFQVARYHSLAIVPAKEIRVTASVDDIPMALQHRKWPVYAVQFHPESFLSEYGPEILKNFYKISDLEERAL